MSRLTPLLTCKHQLAHWHVQEGQQLSVGTITQIKKSPLTYEAAEGATCPECEEADDISWLSALKESGN